MLMGGEKISDDGIWEIFETLHMKETVKETPKGLDSIFGDDTNFSGGQLQLLCIARVILQDRPILILDEATGQLDAENEFDVMRLLLEKKHNKIIFFITHRMTTLRHADKIACLE